MKKLMILGCLLLSLLVFGIQPAFSKVIHTGRNKILIVNQIGVNDSADLRVILDKHWIIKHWIIEINSPGGIVPPGIDMFNSLKELSKNGVKITTIIRGEADSMAAILFLVGDERIIYNGAHVSQGLYG